MGGPSSQSKSESYLPAWYVPYAKRSLEMGDEHAKTGYVPYQGPDVASFAPQQQQAMQGANNWSAAFGKQGTEPINAMAGVDLGEKFGAGKDGKGGFMGLSSAPGYFGAVNKLAETRPGQYNALKSFFIDPITGAAPTALEEKIDKKVRKQDKRDFFNWRQNMTTPFTHGDYWPGPDDGGGSN